MVSVSTVEHDAAVVGGGFSGLGQLLRQARQARGLAQAELARQLNLDAHLVDALEREDLGALPGPVYVRGYLRNIAQALKVDEAELLHAYVRLVGVPQPAQLRHSKPVEPMRTPRGARKDMPWLKITALLLVLAAAVYAARFLPESLLDGSPFGLGSENGASVPVTTTPPDASAAASVALAPSIPLSIDPPPVVEPVAAPMVGEVVSSPSGPTTEAIQQTPASLPGLELRVSGGDSWVQVKDAGGRVILEELLKSGTVRQLDGTRPFQIVIGNRATLTLALDGQPVDLNAYGRPNGKAFIARLGD